MKTDKSSNTQDTNRKVFHPENHEAMKEKEKLQGRDSGDGREGSYKIKDEIDAEKTDDQVSSMKSDASESSVKANQEDVKKEFEIRSESKDEMNKGIERDKDPVAETSEQESEGDEKSESGSEWRKSYKGDAELVP